MARTPDKERSRAYRLRRKAKFAEGERLKVENAELKRRIIELEGSIDPGDIVEPAAKKPTAKRKLETA